MEQAVLLFSWVRAMRSSSLAGLALVFTLPLSLQGCILLPQGKPPQGGAAASSAADSPTLRDAASRIHRRVGAALATYHFGDSQYTAVAARHFDSLTPENEMKWETIQPQPDTFAFQAGDALVAFAGEHGMRVRGHTLVWHSQLAPWVKGLTGDTLHSAMIDHVKRVAGHYKGRIAEWDVVNEALADGPSGELRGDSPFTALGPTFIDDAFRAAHEADPDALLFYNDYEIEAEGSAKTEAALRLVGRLKESGVPIHGVGFQMHVDPRHWPTAAAIAHNLERFTALGLFVEITEMDVPVGAIAGTLEEKMAQQKVLTHDIVAACLGVPKCSGITFWGISDKDSWLNDEKWGALRGARPHYPLPFDSSYAPKPMYAGILDALEGR
jgi:endo-1,4-beta-xylanase